MAINSKLTLAVQIVGDGSSTTFNFDYTKDPFFLETVGNLPTDVQLNGAPSGTTATVTGTVVSLTFTTAPGTGVTSFDIFLLFAGV